MSGKGLNRCVILIYGVGMFNLNGTQLSRLTVCVCVRACACVRACVRVCMRVCLEVG